MENFVQQDLRQKHEKIFFSFPGPFSAKIQNRFKFSSYGIFSRVETLCYHILAFYFGHYCILDCVIDKNLCKILRTYAQLMSHYGVARRQRHGGQQKVIHSFYSIAYKRFQSNLSGIQNPLSIHKGKTNGLFLSCLYLRKVKNAFSGRTAKSDFNPQIRLFYRAGCPAGTRHTLPKRIEFQTPLVHENSRYSGKDLFQAFSLSRHIKCPSFRLSKACFFIIFKKFQAFNYNCRCHARPL